MKPRDALLAEAVAPVAVEAAAAAAEETGFVALARAISGWRAALGEDAVLVDHGRQKYEANCIGLARSVPVALRPRSEDEVRAIVAVASECAVPLYPVSTGNNWGYGSATPSSERCVVVDLSRMDRVLGVDPDLGLVTVQPGVTQGSLRAYLDQRRLPFMVPVTGAGPTCSLVGNALDRGYGITPHADHFAAVRSIRAVLANGEVYRSALAAAGGGVVDGAQKWGIGPYLDGLYSQGGFGIVTEMTLALARLPERVEAFVVELDDDRRLEPLVEAVRGLLQAAGGGIGGVNLINRLRLLAMVHPYPARAVAPGQAIPPELIEAMGSAAAAPRWLCLGALYGDDTVVAGLRRAVRRRLGPVGGRLRFVSRRHVALARRIAGLAPRRLAGGLARRAGMAEEILDILSGRPRETALKLAYWKTRRAPPSKRPLDPARDGCGIIWFSPLVPMKAAAVRTYVDLAHEICPRYGVDPLITLTTVSEHCFDSTLPILYDRALGPEAAHACYDALLEACHSHGFLPYRMDIRSMRRLADDGESPYWRMVRSLKRAIDPADLIAPGRYAPLA
jgi:FAD/FMN-containing dehydrogenase